MLSTIQVREIINRYIVQSYFNPVYTNKLAEPLERSVKCYIPSDGAVAAKLLTELQQKAGFENVKITKGATHAYAAGPGITVRCIIA